MTLRTVIRAPAKLNLRLRILAREASGYHQIETLFGAVDWGDRMELAWEPGGEGIDLEVVGTDLGPVKDNLVHRAAVAFLEASRVRARIGVRLEKEIPAGGGLGGGSSDAGMLLRVLNRLAERALPPKRLVRVAAELGADVPFFLSRSPFALGWGRGDRILPLSPPPSTPVLLALPPMRVETPRAYGLLREAAAPVGAADLLPSAHELSRWEVLSALAHNDFQEVIFPRHPILAELHGALLECGSRFALLAGSGACLFGVYDSEGRMGEAAAALSGRFPRVRFVATRTLERFPPECEDRPARCSP